MLLHYAIKPPFNNSTGRISYGMPQQKFACSCCIRKQSIITTENFEKMFSVRIVHVLSSNGDGTTFTFDSCLVSGILTKLSNKHKPAYKLVKNLNLNKLKKEKKTTKTVVQLVGILSHNQ